MAKKKINELQSVELPPSQVQTYNQNNYTHIMEIAKITTPVLSSEIDVKNAIEQYFGLCEKNNVKPIMSGLGIVLGLSRKDILDIVSGQKKCETAPLITRAYQFVEAFDEMAMKDGKIPPIIAIFNAKNNYGYTDGAKIEIVKEELTNEEIAERYRKMHEIVSEVDDRK